MQPATAEVHVGQIARFDAIATYSDDKSTVETRNATWSGGNGNTFISNKAGVYTLTATFNGVSRSATIFVKDYQLVAITVEPSSATIQVGQRLDLSASANFEHMRFDDVTAEAVWSGGGPFFSGTTPGQYDVSATYGGKTATARITVKAASSQQGATGGAGSSSSDVDDLADQMMNDPTRSGTSAHPSLSDPDIGDFSSVPSRPAAENTLADDDGWNGLDVDQQAQAKNDVRRARDDSLHGAAQQRDREQNQAWDQTAHHDLDDRHRQEGRAQQALAGTRQQGQAASAAEMDALANQQQRQDAFNARMAELERTAAENSKPAAATNGSAGNAGQGDSGGLTSVTVSQRNVTIKIWDHGSVDNDIVKLKINGAEVTPEITLKGPAEPFVYNANLPQQTNRIEIVAVNEGTAKPNTATVWTSHVTQGEAQQKYSINQAEYASYGITVSF
jgi:hypothetical protein